MPGDPGATVVTNARAFYTTRAAAGATGTRHSPRPLWGGKLMHNSGAMRRLIANLRLELAYPGWSRCLEPTHLQPLRRDDRLSLRRWRKIMAKISAETPHELASFQ